MSDDWKPGDLALCVKRGQWSNNSGVVPFLGPQAGQVFTVERPCLAPSGALGLILEGVETPRHRNGKLAPWGIQRFRKIHPLSIEERNAEIRLLTGLPVKEPVT